MLFVFFGFGSFAQQLPQSTQYMINDYVLNPAIGGNKSYFDAKANQRLQWVGVTDAPRTFVFSLHGPMQNQKVGLGGFIFSDITGPTRRTGAKISYAYHFKLTDDIKLSLNENIPFNPNEKKSKYSILNLVRQIDEKGKMKFFDINVGIESKFWNTNYQGEYGKIIYGHTPIIQNKPVYFQNSICIDNGCVFGGWLSALLIDKNLKIVLKFTPKIHQNIYWIA